jgi:hypothetical protein
MNGGLQKGSIFLWRSSVRGLHPGDPKGYGEEGSGDGCPFTGNSEKLLKGGSADWASLSMGALLGEPGGGAPCWGP